MSVRDSRQGGANSEREHLHGFTTPRLALTALEMLAAPPPMFVGLSRPHRPSKRRRRTRPPAATTTTATTATMTQGHQAEPPPWPDEDSGVAVVDADGEGPLTVAEGGEVVSAGPVTGSGDVAGAVTEGDVGDPGARVTSGLAEEGGSVAGGAVDGPGVCVASGVGGGGGPVVDGTLGDTKNSAVTEMPPAWLATTRCDPPGVGGTWNSPWKLPSAATATSEATTWPANVIVTGPQVAESQKFVPLNDTGVNGGPWVG